MVALLSVLSAAAWLTSQVFASSEPAEVINARQLSGLNPNSLPQQCQSDCSSTKTSVSGCTNLSCVCKDSIISGLGQCLNCAVSVQNAGLDIQTAQAVIDDVVSGCKSAGTPVNNVTISAKGSDSSKGNGAAHSTVIGVGTLFVALLGASVTLV